MLYLILALAVIIVILVVFLFFPFQIFFNLIFEGLNFQGKVKVKFMGLTIISRSLERKEEKKVEEEKVEEKKAEGGAGGRLREMNLSQILEGFKLFFDASPYIRSILNAFIRSLSLKKFKADIKIGFKSSVDTEFITGCLWGFSAILKPVSSVQFNVNPIFDEEMLKGTANIHVELRLFRIVLEFLRSLTHKPVRSFIWFAVRSNSKENKNGIFKRFKRGNSGSTT